MAKRKKPTDEQGQDNDNLNDDSFGLPDLEYKPLETPQDEQPPVIKEEVVVEKETVTENPFNNTETKRETETRTTYTQSYMEEEEEENGSKAPIVIGVVIALVLIVASALIYFYVWKPRQETKAREQAELVEKERVAAEEARKRAEAEEAERQRLANEKAAVEAKPAIGTIETLTDRTKRYYVVITSAVDGDLVMDYAKKLSAKGVSTKIIPPFGKYKFSRLAIGDFETFTEAQASADTSKGEYGGAVWVLKF